jgi:hypothetical protein
VADGSAATFVLEAAGFAVVAAGFAVVPAGFAVVAAGFAAPLVAGIAVRGRLAPVGGAELPAGAPAIAGGRRLPRFVLGTGSIVISIKDSSGRAAAR